MARKKSKADWMGIDTSAYTTSVALALADGEVLNLKQPLDVGEGERGLRQSTAFFKHIQNLPILFGKAAEAADLSSLKGIGVSKTPRRAEGSYMPVFEAGLNFAKSLGAVVGVPVLETSHQENHIEAAAHGSGFDPSRGGEFLAVHFSGGTSEILRARESGTGYSVEIVAKSLDLKAGQLIDRIGVGFGLPFPAGAALERLAARARKRSVSIPSRLDGADFHFSGQENYANNLIEKGTPREEVADALFRMVAKTIERSIRRVDTEARSVLLSGGVMSNSLIKEELTRRLAPAGYDLFFAPPALSSDNAVGNALMAKKHFERQ